MTKTLLDRIVLREAGTLGFVLVGLVIVLLI